MEQTEIYFPRNPGLTPYIESIWHLKSGTGPLPYLLPPDPGFTMVLSFASNTTVHSSPGSIAAVSGDFSTGIRTRPVTLIPEGPVDYTAVQFTPLGFRTFFKTDGQELKDAFVPLTSIDADLERIKERIGGNGNSRAERNAAVEGMLLSLLNRDTPAAPPYLSRAVELIRQTGGRLKIGALCGDIGITARQLQREFDRWIGVPVKFYCRVVRVNRALEYLQSCSAPCDLAELAADLGYYDQPHLCGEFAELVGMTPGQIHCGGMPG